MTWWHDRCSTACSEAVKLNSLSWRILYPSSLLKCQQTQSKNNRLTKYQTLTSLCRNSLFGFSDLIIVLTLGGSVCLFRSRCQAAIQCCMMGSKPQGGDPTVLQAQNWLSPTDLCTCGLPEGHNILLADHNTQTNLFFSQSLSASFHHGVHNTPVSRSLYLNRIPI